MNTIHEAIVACLAILVGGCVLISFTHCAQEEEQLNAATKQKAIESGKYIFP